MRHRIRLLAGVIGSVAAVGAVEAGVGTAVPQAENPYASAEFTVSSDPKAVVLFVQGHSMMVDETQSMRLFGDGRLELALSGRSPQPERRVLQLDESAQQELLAIAVRHGLAEWDTTRIESEKAIVLNGRQRTTADGYVVSVTLVLETYQRGSLDRSNVRKKMSVSNPDVSVNDFPGVYEFRGLFELQKYLQRVSRAEGL